MKHTPQLPSVLRTGSERAELVPEKKLMSIAFPPAIGSSSPRGEPAATANPANAGWLS